MKRLLENKLIFGRLLSIAEPHLIERYNQALKGFNLKPTKLKQFSIDMTGFSPEVAEELGDPQYMDPKGINRRFIILSPEQAELPVVHTAFSNTEQLMYEFFKANARALYALTIKDVVFGEIEDSIFEINSIDDLLSMEQVEFKVTTGTKLLGKAAELKVMVDRLLKEPDAWRNDELLTEMVDAAKVTGDIRTNELMPASLVFRHDTFWTSHFGGLYLFTDENQVTVIADPAAKGFKRSRPWQVSYLDINDAEQVFEFLEETGRLDPPRGSWIERSGLLKKRMEMSAVWQAFKWDENFDAKQINNAWFKGWVRSNWRRLERESSIPLLIEVMEAVKSWDQVDMDDLDDEECLLVSRANPEHRDRYLVNRLIGEFLPFDYVTLFIHNKPKFYELYRSWPEGFRDYVVKDLTSSYMKNKRAYRDKLFR